MSSSCTRNQTISSAGAEHIPERPAACPGCRNVTSSGAALVAKRALHLGFRASRSRCFRPRRRTRSPHRRAPAVLAIRGIGQKYVSRRRCQRARRSADHRRTVRAPAFRCTRHPRGHSGRNRQTGRRAEGKTPARPCCPSTKGPPSPGDRAHHFESGMEAAAGSTPIFSPPGGRLSQVDAPATGPRPDRNGRRTCRQASATTRRQSFLSGDREGIIVRDEHRCVPLPATSCARALARSERSVHDDLLNPLAADRRDPAALWRRVLDGR